MSQKQAVLKLLSDRKPHASGELYALGCVAHSRVSDLRRDGFEIRQWRQDGLYLYQLTGRLDDGAAAGVASSSSASSIPASNPLHVSHGECDRHDESRGGDVLGFSSQRGDASDDVTPLTFASPGSGVGIQAPRLFECEIDESAGQRGAYWDDAA